MSDESANNTESAQEFRQAALDYHRLAPRGKIKVAATKPMLTQRDLALAYSPGVAYACEEIAADPGKASDYTARGNLVAVISNGTAVLGLGEVHVRHVHAGPALRTAELAHAPLRAELHQAARG